MKIERDRMRGQKRGKEENSFYVLLLLGKSPSYPRCFTLHWDTVRDLLSNAKVGF